MKNLWQRYWPLVLALFGLFAVIVFGFTSSPAHAQAKQSGMLGHTIEEVLATAPPEAHATITKLTPEQKINVDAASGPQPVPGDLYICRIADKFAMLMIVQDNRIVLVTPPIPLASAEKVLLGKGTAI